MQQKIKGPARLSRIAQFNTGILFLATAFLFSCKSAPIHEEKKEDIPILDKVAVAKAEEVPEEFRDIYTGDEQVPGPINVKEDPKQKKKVIVEKPKKTTKPKMLTFPNRRPKVDPIWLGEEQELEISYFGVPAGLFTLKALPFTKIQERKVYHIQGRAISSKLFSVFYRLDDMVETFFDYTGLFSHKFHLTLNETKQTRDALELYDYSNLKTFYWNRWNHYKKGFVEEKKYEKIQPLTQDSLSALYYVRSLPLKNGEKYTFPVVSESKTWTAQIEVIRREMMKTAIGRVRTIVLKPETKFKGNIKKTGDSFIWLTDDDRRWIVRIEAKVKIGAVVATLKKVVKGTRP